MKIDARGLHYRELNERIRAAIDGGEKELVLENVLGQRYIGTGIVSDARIELRGVAGQDLAAFMSGPTVRVRGSVQDGVGNTMNAGTVLVHGGAGDLLGHSMRGGTVMVRGDAGYRVAIHMKAFGERFPVIVIGGRVRDYAGEYMAGGLLVILNLDGEGRFPAAGQLLGTGMHGGEIFLRGRVEPHQLGKEVGQGEVGEAEWARLSVWLDRFCAEFGVDRSRLRRGDFIRLRPATHRPYGTLYVY